MDEMSSSPLSNGAPLPTPEREGSVSHSENSSGGQSQSQLGTQDSAQRLSQDQNQTQEQEQQGAEELLREAFRFYMVMPVFFASHSTMIGGEERSGPPPTPKSVVEKLVRTKVGEKGCPIPSLASAPGELPSCSVCLCEFEKDEDIIELPCKHVFHAGCVTSWLERHNSCPNCRSAIPVPEDNENNTTRTSGENVRTEQPDSEAIAAARAVAEQMMEQYMRSFSEAMINIFQNQQEDDDQQQGPQLQNSDHTRSEEGRTTGTSAIERGLGHPELGQLQTGTRRGLSNVSYPVNSTERNAAALARAEGITRQSSFAEGLRRAFGGRLSTTRTHIDSSQPGATRRAQGSATRRDLIGQRSSASRRVIPSSSSSSSSSANRSGDSLQSSFVQGLRRAFGNQSTPINNSGSSSSSSSSSSSANTDGISRQSSFAEGLRRAFTSRATPSRASTNQQRRAQQQRRQAHAASIQTIPSGPLSTQRAAEQSALLNSTTRQQSRTPIGSDTSQNSYVHWLHPLASQVFNLSPRSSRLSSSPTLDTSAASGTSEQRRVKRRRVNSGGDHNASLCGVSQAASSASAGTQNLLDTCIEDNQNREELMSCSISTLKRLLKGCKVDFSTCIEKHELVDLLLKATENHHSEQM